MLLKLGNIEFRQRKFQSSQSHHYLGWGPNPKPNFSQRKKIALTTFPEQITLDPQHFLKISQNICSPLKTPPKKRATHNFYPLEVWFDFTNIRDFTAQNDVFGPNPYVPLKEAQNVHKLEDFKHKHTSS